MESQWQSNVYCSRMFQSTPGRVTARPVLLHKLPLVLSAAFRVISGTERMVSRRPALAGHKTGSGLFGALVAAWCQEAVCGSDISTVTLAGAAVTKLAVPGLLRMLLPPTLGAPDSVQWFMARICLDRAWGTSPLLVERLCAACDATKAYEQAEGRENGGRSAGGMSG